MATVTITMPDEWYALWWDFYMHGAEDQIQERFIRRLHESGTCPSEYILAANRQVEGGAVITFKDARDANGDSDAVQLKPEGTCPRCGCIPAGRGGGVCIACEDQTAGDSDAEA